MSIACTRINNEPLSTSLLVDEKEPNVFNNIIHKRDGASQIANETKMVSLAVLENWVNVTASRSPTKIPNQQPQRQDETQGQGAFEVSATREQSLKSCLVGLRNTW